MQVHFFMEYKTSCIVNYNVQVANYMEAAINNFYLG